MQLILAVSLRRRRSLPKAAIHGLPLPLSVRSLSARASEMSARSGIPRSAATDLARRKIASGISSVVFIPCMFPYLWVTVNWLTIGRMMSSLAVCRRGLRYAHWPATSAPHHWAGGHSHRKAIRERLTLVTLSEQEYVSALEMASS